MAGSARGSLSAHNKLFGRSNLRFSPCVIWCPSVIGPMTDPVFFFFFFFFFFFVCFFINYLPDNIRSSVRLFADDCVLCIHEY